MNEFERDEYEERVAIMRFDARMGEDDAVRLARMVVRTPSRDGAIWDEILASVGKREAER